MTRPQVRDDLHDLAGYHSPQLDVDVRLNTNEAPEGPPAGYVAAVEAAVGAVDWHRYPDRAATELRTRIGTLHGRGPDEIFCANGSNEVLQSILLAYAGFGRRVLTFEPTYAMHAHIARIVGSTPVAAERDADFRLQPGPAAATVAECRPAVTFLTSPNNPTGLVEPDEVIDAVLEAVEAVDGLLVVDEAYGQFAPRSALERVDEDRSLVVTRTFSKTWAMAGARLGYAVGPTWVVDQLWRVVLPYHLDALKQAAGVAALDFVDEMDARVRGIVAERERLVTALTELGATVWPSGANFVLFRPTGATGGDDPAAGRTVWQRLVDRSVLVRDTSSWDHLDGCLRVTVGTPADNDRFLAALADVLAGPAATADRTTDPGGSSGEKSSGVKSSGERSSGENRSAS
ncbi:MAG: histidinol-phosphate transaminase [Acidimicrobiales bacterium]